MNSLVFSNLTQKDGLLRFRRMLNKFNKYTIYKYHTESIRLFPTLIDLFVCRLSKNSKSLFLNHSNYFTLLESIT